MTLSLSRSEIDSLEQRYRANFLNCLSGFKGTTLLGSRSASGQDNLALISSTFHVGAAPPLIAVLFRPHSVPRHSLENLLATDVYTLNHVSADMVEQAHKTSARWPEEVSEFDACGLTPEATDAVDAPYVAESPICIAMRREETHTLVNETVLVVGEVLEVRMREDKRADDGHLDLSTLDVVTACGMDAYHTTTRVARLPYAKPDGNMG